ncbi:MAG: hypothetical protein KDA93_00290 [Planctomycetaceae bacterium]|nr:hypothetical protein [Planctomycetaceae bacterium]
MRSLIGTLALLALVGCQRVKSSEEAAPAAEVKPAEGEEKAPAVKKPEHFKKRVAELVDKKKAMADNPNLVETKNAITSDNYAIAITQGYFAAASKVQLIQLEHTVRNMQALEDRWPTLEEFQKILTDNNIKLGHLYPYQMYFYDPETGEIGILEDSVKRQELKDAAAW